MSEGLTLSQLAEKNALLVTENAALQQKLDAVLAKGMELAKEAAHVYAEYNKEMAPDVVCDGQTIQEFYDLANGWSSVDSYLNEVLAEAELEGMVRGAGRVALEASRVYRDAPNRSEERSLHKRIGNFAHMIARRIRAEGATND